MESKNLTIQELENIKIEDFKDKPQELSKIGRNLLNAKRFEKAIEILEEALKQMIKLKSYNETDLECAKYYYYYADALIFKISETADLFAENVNYEEEKKAENGNAKNENNSEKKIENEKSEEPESTNNNINLVSNNNNEEDTNNVDEEEEEDDSDEKVAFNHLAIAEKILKENLQKYEGIDPKELPTKIIEYFLDLSDVYLKFGELELVNSDFKKAIEYYDQSLLYKNIYDLKFSRAVAEVYYMIGNACDFDVKKALLCYYKAYLIMLFHLLEKLGKDTQHINIEFDTVKYNEVKLYEDELKLDDNDSDDVRELKLIMSDLKIKIEDAIEETRISESYIKEKIEEKQGNGFAKNYDENKLIDLNKTGIIKKKVREELKSDDNSNYKIGKIVENNEIKTVNISECEEKK